MWVAIAGYIFVVYPLKYIIHPILRIIYENIYVILACFVMWVNFTIAGSPSEANALLSAKLRANPGSVMWIIEPIITIYGTEITPLMLFTLLLGALIIYRAYDILNEVWWYIKMWVGHILMISLWGWYTLIGNKEMSMMCLRSPLEKRSLLVFYGLILIAIAGVILILVLQDATTNLMFSAFNFTATPVNETIETSANMTIIPMNVSTSSVIEAIK